MVTWWLLYNMCSLLGEPGTVRVTKVEVHATEFDVEQGRVRAEDRFGNSEADAAADLGRRSQTKRLIDARRALLCVRDIWYPIVRLLHRFMVAISRVSVNHDGKGGTAPDALVWDQGGLKKRRKIQVRVNVDLATPPGPPGFLQGSWMQVSGGNVTGADIAAWPYSVGLICNFVAFLGSLHWPTDAGDMGHFGFHTFRCLSFSSTSQVTGCLVKRLLACICVLIGLFIFLLHLLLKDFQSGLGASLLALFSGRLINCPVGYPSLFLVVSEGTCPDSDTWGGYSVLMVSHLGHWNPVIIHALGLYVIFWGIQGVQQRSF